jgi:hypothetical protein
LDGDHVAREHGALLLVEHVEPIGVDLDRFLVVRAEIAERRRTRGGRRWRRLWFGGLTRPALGRPRLRVRAPHAEQGDRKHRGEKTPHGRKLAG